MDSFSVSQWVQLIITLTTIAIGGVWVVGSIKTTTAVLSSKIEQLGKAIESLQGVCQAMTADHHALVDRVSRLETKMETSSKPRKRRA
jgi:prefoldin subunit 5